MITGDVRAQAFPLLRYATREIYATGIKLPPERLLGAALYPKVQTASLLHIRRLEKTKTIIKLIVVDDADTEVCEIIFDLVGESEPYRLPKCVDDYCGRSVGYAIQNGELCGCLVGDTLFIKILKALPATTFDIDALTLDPSVCHIRIKEEAKSGRLLYEGKEVRSVVFKETPEDGSGQTIQTTEGGSTVDLSSARLKENSTAVTKIILNNSAKHVLGGVTPADEQIDHVCIKTIASSGVRVVTGPQEITIGKLESL